MYRYSSLGGSALRIHAIQKVTMKVSQVQRRIYGPIALAVSGGQ